MGDRLDDLLNSLASPGVYEPAVGSCVRSLGVDPTPWLQARAAEAAKGAQLQGDPSQQLVGSGLAQIALQSLSFDPASAAQQAPPTQISSELNAALVSNVEYLGKSYENGCAEYGDEAVRNDEAEVLRTELSKSYEDNVGKRMFADERWHDENLKWSACMSAAGFANLDKPGSELSIIQQRISEAGRDAVALRSVVDFDEAITKASGSCFLSTQANRRSIREEYESEWVKKNSSQLDKLVLLKAEHSSGSASSS